MSIKSFIKKILYFGQARFCNVCESHIRRFKPLSASFIRTASSHGHDHNVSDYETLNSDEYLCPICYATDRERFYRFFIDREWDLSKQKNLLEFAPGSLQSFLKSSSVQYRSCDLFMGGVDDNFDIQNLRYNRNSFDYIICSHVLEHVPDDSRALCEIYRILKPGGSGIIMVPISTKLQTTREVKNSVELKPSEKWRLFGQDDHVRLYCKTDFINLLNKCGFDVRQLTAADYIGSRSSVLGIQNSATIYVVEVRK